MSYQQEVPGYLHEMAVHLEGLSVESSVKGIQESIKKDLDPKNGSSHCACGNKISEVRRQAVPGTKKCLECASKSDPRRDRVPAHLLRHHSDR